MNIHSASLSDAVKGNPDIHRMQKRKLLDSKTKPSDTSIRIKSKVVFIGRSHPFWLCLPLCRFSNKSNNYRGIRMKKMLLAVFVSLLAGTTAFSQDTSDKPTQPKTITITESKAAATAPAKTRGPVFRPTKEQIKQVQAMLKERSLYAGEATGTYNKETRDGIRSFQKENGLKETGTLNRATLEKMNVELTDNQKAIPVSEGSYATAKEEKPAKSKASGPSDPDAKPKKPAVFRATVDQIKEAQRILKSRSIYGGEETGKLDDDTRAALKKYQESSSLKPTATLNQATLESLGIELTEKQKGIAEQKK